MLVWVPFYFCLPSDKYIRPCNWGKEGRGVVREKGEGKKKSGGVEGYGCFSLGDRACCHGAGPPIGGSPVQSLNSTDCFIIEKFFLSSRSHWPPLSPPPFYSFPHCCTLAKAPPQFIQWNAPQHHHAFIALRMLLTVEVFLSTHAVCHHSTHLNVRCIDHLRHQNFTLLAF